MSEVLNGYLEPGEELRRLSLKFGERVYAVKDYLVGEMLKNVYSLFDQRREFLQQLVREVDSLPPEYRDELRLYLVMLRAVFDDSIKWEEVSEEAEELIHNTTKGIILEHYRKDYEYDLIDGSREIITGLCIKREEKTGIILGIYVFAELFEGGEIGSAVYQVVEVGMEIRGNRYSVFVGTERHRRPTIEGLDPNWSLEFEEVVWGDMFYIYRDQDEFNELLIKEMRGILG